ncbi:MAG: hypothetical protein AAFY73_07390 [Pseudomonadota bacterium]
MNNFQMKPLSFAPIGIVALAALSMAAAAQSTHQSADRGACGVSLSARFIEGAPTDRFEISNNSADGWSVTSATFDLAPAPAGLIFDTENGGGGLQVFQPFEASDSTAKLAGTSGLSDGGTSLTIDFASFAPGETFAFTIDIDDSLENSARSQTQVVGNEIEGAVLTAAITGSGGRSITIEGTFGAYAFADVQPVDCG